MVNLLKIAELEERVEALEKLAEEYFKVPVEPSTDIKEDKQ